MLIAFPPHCRGFYWQNDGLEQKGVWRMQSGTDPSILWPWRQLRVNAT